MMTTFRRTYEPPHLRTTHRCHEYRSVMFYVKATPYSSTLMPANKNGSRSAKERNELLFAALRKAQVATWTQLLTLTKFTPPRLTAGLKSFEGLRIVEHTWSKVHKSVVYRWTGLPLPKVTITKLLENEDMKRVRKTVRKKVVTRGGICSTRRSLLTKEFHNPSPD